MNNGAKNHETIPMGFETDEITKRQKESAKHHETIPMGFETRMNTKFAGKKEDDHETIPMGFETLLRSAMTISSSIMKPSLWDLKPR